MLYRSNNNHSLVARTGIAQELTAKGIGHFSDTFKRTRFDLLDSRSVYPEQIVHPLGGLAVFEDWHRPRKLVHLSTEITAVDLDDCFGPQAEMIARTVQDYQGTINGVSIGLDDENKLVARRTLEFVSKPDNLVDPRKVAEDIRTFGNTVAFLAKTFLPQD